MSSFVRKVSLAVLAMAMLASLAAAQNNVSRFDLHPNPAFLSCLGTPGGPTPTAHVTVQHGDINDILTIEGKNIKPNLGFDLFTVQRSNLLANGDVDPNFTNVGLAWYQSDLQADATGHFKTTIKTVLINEIFGVDADVNLAPTNTFHLGFWFDNPNDANVDGCVFDVTKPTPFNGEHDAGPLAMITVPNDRTNLGPLCTDPVNGHGTATCNP